MEISHFELLYKPQSPASPNNTPAVERVVQGYFLEITNLENVEYRYAVEFVIFPPPVAAPNQAFRSLAGNTVALVDTGGVDNQVGVLSGTLGSSVFRLSTGFIRVPANGTALLAVLPSVFPLPIDPTPIANPVFEVRGFVRITLPAVFPSGPPFTFPFFRVPQANAPVRVLLTPQHRATFLTATGAISDQIQASLPLATGRALYSLPPEPGGPLVFEVGNFRLNERLPAILRGLGELQDIGPSELLAAMLGQVDPETTDLRAFNDALRQAGIPIGLEVRGRRQ